MCLPTFHSKEKADKNLFWQHDHSEQDRTQITGRKYIR